MKKFKERARELLNRNHGKSTHQRLQELTQYLRGWINYFAQEQRKSVFTELDKWLRRRLRACLWKQWRLPRTRIQKLKQLGVAPEEAYSHGNSRKGPWRLAKSLAVSMAMPVSWLTDLGLFNLSNRWSELAPVRRKRLVRNRMLGVVGGVRSNAALIPIGWFCTSFCHAHFR